MEHKIRAQIQIKFNEANLSRGPRLMLAAMGMKTRPWSRSRSRSGGRGSGRDRNWDQERAIGGRLWAMKVIKACYYEQRCETPSTELSWIGFWFLFLEAFWSFGILVRCDARRASNQMKRIKYVKGIKRNKMAGDFKNTNSSVRSRPSDCDSPPLRFRWLSSFRRSARLPITIAEPS